MNLNDSNQGTIVWPEELGMFSEALRILDENTAKFMIEELQKKVEEKDAEISKKDAVIEEKDLILDKKEALLNELNSTIDKINAENEALKKQLRELSEHR